MTIYNKFIIHHSHLDVNDSAREFTPFEINMLNALLTATGGIEPRQGELIEHTSRHWTLIYTKDGRPQRIDIVMTDEELGDKYKQDSTPDMFSDKPKLKGPKFK